ncbi:MAG TPA: hypothetical protein VGJ74_03290 [Burkholderiales bacterium]|jgi:hypothetical protein
MSAPHFKISARDVPDLEACVRRMQHEARRLSGRYPALAGLHFELEASAAQFAARIDLRFPQHQLIVNAAAPSAERAISQAAAAAARELLRLEARDRSIAAFPVQAKAA